MTRTEAIAIINARIEVYRIGILDGGKPVSDFDKFIFEQDEALELALTMMQDPVESKPDTGRTDQSLQEKGTPVGYSLMPLLDDSGRSLVEKMKAMTTVITIDADEMRRQAGGHDDGKSEEH